MVWAVGRVIVWVDDDGSVMVQAQSFFMPSRIHSSIIISPQPT